MSTEISYRVNQGISVDEFIDVLERSTLAERRPTEDRACMQGMLEHANLLVTAWDADKLIGVSRSITDFHYACYLSDLAVDDAYQRQGIGRELQRLTQAELGEQCSLILLAAPKAVDYYGRIGFTQHKSAWVLKRHQSIQ